MTVAEEPIGALRIHGEVPIAFPVERVFVVTLVEDGLGALDRFAYADLPDEIQLMWFKQL